MRIPKKNEVAWNVLDLALGKIDTDTWLNLTPTVNWGDLRRYIEALPLSTEQYGVCVNGLLNAEKYIAEKEYGAAAFEIRMLRRRLKAASYRLGW